MANLDFLNCYKVSADTLRNGAEIVLDQGVKCVMRPRPNPNYDSAMAEAIKDMKEGEDELILDRCIADHVLVSIGDISDKNIIFDILQNEDYLFLKNEVYRKSVQISNFVSSRVQKVKKN